MRFYCSATGKPIPTIKWLRYNLQLDSSVQPQFTITYSTEGSVCGKQDLPTLCNSSSRLEILNSRAVDSGEYSCVATNNFGSDMASAELTVNGKLVYMCTVHQNISVVLNLRSISDLCV